MFSSYRFSILILSPVLLPALGWSETPRIGEPFPEIAGTSVKGEEVSLASLEGKPVLVDFWATWCEPCMAEMPKLVSIYMKFKDRGFEILAISLDQSPDEINSYLARYNLPWPVLHAPGGWRSEWAEALSVDAIPAYFLIRPDGTLASKSARGPRLIEWIRHLLDPNYPLAPDVEEEFAIWKDTSGAERKAAEDRILNWAGSLALVDEMNGTLWREILRPFHSEEDLSFLLSASEKTIQTHPKKKYLDTYAYALYKSGEFSEAAEAQAEAVQAVTMEEVTQDYGWLLEARLALYLARAGNIPEANRVFTATLARRDEVSQLYSERIDWLGEAADRLDRDYEEPWESESGVDPMFYYARFEGDPDRVQKRYQKLFETLNEEERKNYAIAFGKVHWPASSRVSLLELDNLPLEIEVRDATGDATLVRIRQVSAEGDFALLLDAPAHPEGVADRMATLVVDAPNIETSTRQIAIVGGQTIDLGDFKLEASK